MFDSASFNILFVCHANICRSPMAEFLARYAIADSFGPGGGALRVWSAGTHADEGGPVHPGTVQVLAERGIAVEGSTSRPVTAPMLAAADLVLAAGRPQRAACVALEPRVLRRTFTLRQFARIAGAMPAVAPRGGAAGHRFRTLLEELPGWRHHLQPVSADEDDLADPVRRPIEAFRTCATAIERDLYTILSAVARL
ncbi:low molecular weight phosphatase family protein [Actinoplanes sp. NPDC049548]|uniref:arsenate reductase/protein-tyrosine-phosphatase family protein n=1 Tax=Actinoplanes sp. NPDC049548 TaxID=3155152 RepID=UPI00342E61EE